MRSAVTASGTAAATDVQTGRDRPASVRCNAPQRTPRAPDTSWGRPRGARGWSLRELEARTGINAGELSRIERGRSTPSYEQARAIVRAYEGEA